MYYLGRFLGLVFMYTIIKPMRVIYGKKKRINIYNEDLMKSLRGSSIIVVSNHIKPRNRFLKLISIPYDAFIIRDLFLKYGIYTTALTSYDGGKIRKGQKLSKAKKRKELLTKGIVESMDLIPLNRNEKDEDTAVELNKRFSKGNLGIGIFPEGTWFRGYRKNRKLFSGAAVFGKKYKLNILPVYLKAYNLKDEIILKVGELIPYTLPSEEINSKIREQLNEMSEGVSLVGV